MANIRLQSTLKNETNRICNELNVQPSIAFIRLTLREIFGLDEFAIDEAITDGSMDKGIDAIFELNENGENILYIVQSKYFENPEKSLDESTINKAIAALTNIILDFGSNNLIINSKLKRKAEEYQDRLSNGKIDTVNLVFISNGQKTHQNQVNILENFKDQQDGQIKYEIYSEDDLVRTFAPLSARPVKQISLKIIRDTGSGEKTFITLPDIDFVQGKIAKVDVCELADVVKKNPNIFNTNVRAYQSIRNRVNDEIAKTLRDEEVSKQFIYLNNGITILCDNFDIKPGNEVATIDNPSIINGCQTASTILEVFKENKLKPNTAFVIARIIKSRDEEIKRKIIISSNTQTAVRNRDLVSEDNIQKQLEKQFESLGYYYERKRGQYRDKPQEKVIDLEKAAQYYQALYLRLPAEAKNKKSEIYTSYYEKIFNKDLIAEQFLVGYRLFRKINEKIRHLRKVANEKEKSILGNCTLHLLPLFLEWVAKPEGKILPDFEVNPSLVDRLFEKNIDSVIQKMLSTIDLIAKNEKDFNPQYFFKTADSLNRILGINSEKYTSESTVTLDVEKARRQKDFRYYKPTEYSLDGLKYNKISYWNDLFTELINKYSQIHTLNEGNIEFINSGSRLLLLANPNQEEKKLRKKLKNGLWLLVNYDSKYLCRFCYDLAEKMNIDLKVKIRPTRFRIENKYKIK